MPSSAGGTAATRHTKPAAIDRRRAVRSSRAASTRWKYTCQGMPPKTSSAAVSHHDHQLTGGATATRAW
jgi:hypothetical protein